MNCRSAHGQQQFNQPWGGQVINYSDFTNINMVVNGGDPLALAADQLNTWLRHSADIIKVVSVETLKTEELRSAECPTGERIHGLRVWYEKAEADV